jgi:hypothetical protein
MGSKRRKNTFTRFLEDIVDDTKDFVDDLLDRAKDVEADTRDAVTDAMEDDADDDDRREMESLRSTLTQLRRKVEELSETRNIDLNSMTKAELQELAEEHGVDDVNQNTQTKDEMVAALQRSGVG